MSEFDRLMTTDHVKLCGAQKSSLGFAVSCSVRSFGFGLVGFVVFSTVSGQGLRVQEAAGCRIQTKHA